MAWLTGIYHVHCIKSSSIQLCTTFLSNNTKMAVTVKGQGQVSAKVTQMLLHSCLTKIGWSADNGTPKRLLTNDSCKAEVTQLHLKYSHTWEQRCVKNTQPTWSSNLRELPVTSTPGSSFLPSIVVAAKCSPIRSVIFFHHYASPISVSQYYNSSCKNAANTLWRHRYLTMIETATLLITHLSASATNSFPVVCLAVGPLTPSSRDVTSLYLLDGFQCNLLQIFIM